MSGTVATAAAPLRAVTEALIEGGVQHVAVCPGSRSTPLALALRAARPLRAWIHLDERAGAFFALGAARGGRAPAAILATSGTAVVNFAPAVVEARYGRVPLLLLTADRPPELRGIGAPQTIDQRELYGRHAKWSVELPIPDGSTDSVAESRQLVSQAIEIATTPPAGPVQLDLPYREPLVPLGPLAVDDHESHPRREPRAPATEAVAAVADHLRGAERGLIVCGPLESEALAPAVARLAAAAGVPVMADVLSGLRSGRHDRSHVIVRGDQLVRLDRFAASHRPDRVLRFGARPTSKQLDAWLESLDAPQVLVDDGGGWNQPKGPRLVVADPVALAEAAAGALAGRGQRTDPSWLASWRRADEAAAAAIEGWLEALEEPFEGAVGPVVVAAIEADALVLAGNSMPVRDLEAFVPTSDRAHRFVANRGANGIDGQLSTALGFAVAQSRPVVAILGDIGLIHDLNALAAAARLGIDATVVLVNNDGGGIFSFLPQASTDDADVGLPREFEALFGTPHGLDFGPIVEALGARHLLVEMATLHDALRASIERRGLDVLELRTDRGRNVALHRDVAAKVDRAVEALEVAA